MSKLLNLVKGKINENREKQLLKCVFEGNEYDCSDRSLLQMQIYITASTLSYNLPVEFSWRTLDNQNIPFDLSKIQGLFLTAVQHRYTVYKDSFTTKESLHTLDYDSILNIAGIL